MRLAIVISLLIVFASCKKKPVAPSTPDQFTNGVLVLNEGLYLQNNASLSWYSASSGEVYHQVFSQVNGRGLGDTANDFEIYTLAGKTYIIIAVDISSQIEIVDAVTLESVAQIPLFDGETAREPRKVVVINSRAFVANFDGTVSVIDLLNYEETNNFEVGSNPDGIWSTGTEVFVSNSGGLSPPNYDSTISMINVSGEAVALTLVVAQNMADLVVDTEDDLYVISRGNYDDNPPTLIKVDMDSFEATDFNKPFTRMAYCNDCLYLYHEDEMAVYRMNLLTDAIDAEPLIDCSNHQTFYDIHLDEANQLIYTIDASGYVNSSIIRAYDLNGVFQFEFTAGLNATDLIFL